MQGLISLAVGMVLVCCGSKVSKSFSPALSLYCYTQFYKELQDDTDGVWSTIL